MNETTPGTLNIYKTSSGILPASVLAELVDLARTMDHVTLEEAALGFYRPDWLHDYPYSPEHPLRETLKAADHGLLAIEFSHEPGIETGGTYLAHAKNLHLEIAYGLSGPAIHLPAALRGAELRRHVLEKLDAYERFVRIRDAAQRFKTPEISALQNLLKEPPNPQQGVLRALIEEHFTGLKWRQGASPTVAVEFPHAPSLESRSPFSFYLLIDDEPLPTPFASAVEAHDEAGTLLKGAVQPKAIVLELRDSLNQPIDTPMGTPMRYLLYRDPSG